MRLLIAVSILAITFVAPSVASELENRIQPTGEWFVALSAGFGYQQNPLYEEDDIPQILIPDIRYYGERWSLEGLDLSYNLIEKRGLSVELIAEQNMDGVYFPGRYRNEYGAFSNMHAAATISLLPATTTEEFTNPNHRSMSYLAGVEFRHYGFVNSYLSVQSDVSNVHGGQQVRLEVQKDFEIQRLLIALSAKAIYKSERLTNYYFGYDMRDNPFLHTHYAASDAINYQLLVNFAYSIFDNLAAVSAFRQSWLDTEISDSPVVSKKQTTSFFVGLKYAF